MIDLRRLVNNAAMSVLQAVLSGLTLFILYRYLIQSLGAEQLGLWSVILASTAVARLSDLGLTGTVVKFVARYQALNDSPKSSAVVQTAVISIAFVMGALLSLSYPLIKVVVTWTIPPTEILQAIQILPWALLSLWFGSVGGVFLSGLDGCHQMAVRNALMVVANLLYFAAAFWLVPNYGLLGLAIGQAAQGLFVLAASWIILRRYLTTLPWMPVTWSKEAFREIFGYALNFQINSIAILLIEPATKLLMSRFGGLSSAAYYEMASQLVVKLRGLLISANQALVPAVADLQETTPQAVPALYRQTLHVVLFLTIPFFSALLIALPGISILWIGHREPDFLHFGVLLVVAWGINTITGPAYFFNLGTGDLKWNTAAHVLMAILNVVLGAALGKAFGGLGVAMGLAIALAAASVFLVVAFHKRHQVPFEELLPAEHLWLVALVTSYPILFFIAGASGNNPADQILADAIGLALYSVLVGGVIWFHPYRKSLLKRRLFR